MTIKVKDSRKSAEKWVARSQAAIQDYRSGIETAKSWATGAAQAEGNYEQGVNQAISRKAYGKGVRAAGDEKWKRGASGLGADRYGQGVAAKESDYEAGVAPYLQAMASFSLPKRAPRGSPENYARSQALGQMLHKKRTGGAGQTSA